MSCQPTPYSLFDSEGDPFRKRAVDDRWFCFGFSHGLPPGVTITEVLDVVITSPDEESPNLVAVDDSQYQWGPNTSPFINGSTTIPANQGALIRFRGGTAGLHYDVEIVTRWSDEQVVAGLARMNIDAATGGDC